MKKVDCWSQEFGLKRRGPWRSSLLPKHYVSDLFLQPIRPQTAIHHHTPLSTGISEATLYARHSITTLTPLMAQGTFTAATHSETIELPCHFALFRFYSLIFQSSGIYTMTVQMSQWEKLWKTRFLHSMNQSLVRNMDAIAYITC